MTLVLTMQKMLEKIAKNKIQIRAKNPEQKIILNVNFIIMNRQSNFNIKMLMIVRKFMLSMGSMKNYYSMLLDAIYVTCQQREEF